MTTDSIPPLVYIYALIDPETQQCRYIGKTVNPKNRRRRHFYDRDDSHKAHWITQLSLKGLKPLFQILEVVPPDEDWKEYECNWIAYGYQQGWPLTNISSGGDSGSGYIRTPETRAKLSNALKNIPRTAEWRRNTGLASLGRIDGSKNPKAIVNEQDVLDIRSKYATGLYTQRELAEIYSLSPMQVGKIVNGKVWKSVSGITQISRPRMKLTSNEVQLIREYWHTGNYTQQEIASMFNVTQSAISGIVHNKRWKL